MEKKAHKNKDWFEANISTLERVINAMHSALIRFKRDLSQQNLQTLKPARSKAYQTAGHYANGYWLQLSESIQQASDTGSTRNMYKAIKQVIDKPTKKSALL